MTVKLSILDQSPIAEGSTAMKSLTYTAELAKKAVEWCYSFCLPEERLHRKKR